MQKIPIIYDYDFAYATRGDPSWRSNYDMKKNQNQKHIKMNVYMISIMKFVCSVWFIGPQRDVMNSMRPSDTNMRQ